MNKPSSYKLLNNSRFYILISSILLSLLVLSIMRLKVAGDQLFFIRIQQSYGFLSISYWYLAITISPLGYAIGKKRVKRLEFARRAIGVSAFYFGLLHALVALLGQLGGLNEVQYLPSLFKWSLTGGLLALSILALMAMTSFDAVVRFMTFRRWKWLHRLVYLGGVLVILHIWTIGTHLAYGWVQLPSFVALVTLAGLELHRSIELLNTSYLKMGKPEVRMIFVSLWVAISICILALPTYLQNYHGRHIKHNNHPSTRKHTHRSK